MTRSLTDMATSLPISFVKTPVRLEVACEVCSRAVALVCEGLAGPAGYLVHSEFSCPHCTRLNRLRTPGVILSTSKAAAA